LLNLYQPEKGAVMVDNIPVSHVDPHNLRRQIGYVPQDVVLFHGDIRENILMGATDISDAELLEAIHMACLEPTLAQLPDGLNTEVGERGERLSGGQRQAIGIARALVRKPRLLLMDEPSSMIDPGTENQLIQNLRTHLNDTTLILVTHRMAMLPMVDRLVVFDQVRITADVPLDLVLDRLAAAQSSRQQQTTAPPPPAPPIQQPREKPAAVSQQHATTEKPAATPPEADDKRVDTEAAERQKRAELLASVARKDRLIRQRIKAAKERKGELPKGREARLALAKRKIAKLRKKRQSNSVATQTMNQQGAIGT
jgi:ABC-type polar amino acid transport system ATPase subunit